jgi:anti-anti-sigma factor
VVRLNIPNLLEYRDVALRVVAGVCKLLDGRRLDAATGKWQTDYEFDQQVLSAFGEAFNNLVLHGDAPKGTEIVIELEPKNDGLTIRLMDFGRSFDLTGVPSPDLGDLSESGLGLHIIRSCMDDVSYTPGSPNTLTMTRYLGCVSRSDVGEETILKISGVLDAVSAPEIRPTVDALVGERRRVVTVDLASLRSIDSSGVGVIVSLFKRCKEYGGSVRITGLRDQPLTIFRMLRLDRVFTLP